ncbi:hypothetical protein GTZ97_07910 [Aquabacterium fontiphilum]|uniref:OmpW/AlkL family protein n=1 Tax=Aquabacterium fontiphilum TaxID=450365 RepID=UPI0013784742|nr:OmpW family outer membrane protein [Aquabacterium fontiphilum]NBD20589.1 hypothetical protein [Aquabacterium fontiphilum]
MTLPARMRAGLATVLAASAASWVAPAVAQTSPIDTIFSQVTPSLRDRMFMRLNYIHVNVKTSSGETYDVTGPVVQRGDLATYLGAGTPFLAFNGNLSLYNSSANFLRKYGDANLSAPPTAATPNANGLLEEAIDQQLEATPGCVRLSEGLGTPCGIYARSDSTVGTPAISVGYFLDEARNWSIEAFLLAAPLKVDVMGDGNNALNGVNIIKTKLLPPTASISRHFGARDAALRPHVGLMASYAVFFDTKATQGLADYVGGDTRISIKNAFGWGPTAGFKYQLNDDWHVNLGVGKIRYRTEATLVTPVTVIRSETAVLNDYGSYITNAIGATQVLFRPGSSNGGNHVAGPNDPAGYAPGEAVPAITGLMCDLASAKAGRATCDHGSFTRKQSTKLDNTLFVFSVGRSF